MEKLGNLLYYCGMATKRNRVGIVQEEVTARLREARRAAKLTQDDVAKQLGMSRAGYGHFEDGARSMTLDDLVKLGQIVGRSPGYLLGLEIDLTADEDALLAAFRAIDSERQRRLVLDLARLAAKPEANPEAETTS